MVKKTKINVDMNGKEYMDYLNRRKLSKKHIQSIPYFLLTAIGIIIIIFLISHLTYTEPTPAFDNYYSSLDLDSVDELSWKTIGKRIVVYGLPFLLIVICISWVIHGVGFFISK